MEKLIFSILVFFGLLILGPVVILLLSALFSLIILFLTFIWFIGMFVCPIAILVLED